MSIQNANNNGFTIIELLIVMSIIALVSFVGIKNIVLAQRGAVLEDAHDAVVRGIEQAKNRAASGVGGSSHGVYIDSHSITVFEGDSYNGDGDRYVFYPVITTIPTNQEIIFESISGKASSNNSITISHSLGDTKIINISKDGVITTN